MSEIGEIVDIGRHFFRSPSHFFQFDGSMEGHFCLRSLHFESRIPGSSSRAPEASSRRIWVSKRRVHDMREAEARNQFNRAYARQSAALAKQAIVCGALQFREVAKQIIVVLCKKIENWPTAIAIAIGN